MVISKKENNEEWENLIVLRGNWPPGNRKNRRARRVEEL